MMQYMTDTNHIPSVSTVLARQTAKAVISNVTENVNNLWCLAWERLRAGSQDDLHKTVTHNNYYYEPKLIV